jgi:hypothetical protein
MFMRVVILSIVLIVSAAAKAQTGLSSGFMNFIRPSAFTGNSHLIASSPNKKWFVTSYSGLSAGYSFFNGGNATYIAAPVGLQLNRKLNENLYAFAGVSAAPVYMNFNHSFLSSDITKGYPANGFYKANNLSGYARAELGLMYVNDAKTFSISGSIGVERSSYPILPYPQVNRNNSAGPIHK